MTRIFRAALLASVAAAPACLVLTAGAAYAQTASQNYSIAPQDLDDALRQFARQSGRDVVFDPAVAAGKKSKGVQGSHSAEAALRAVLNGSGLTYTTTSAGFAIRGNGETAVAESAASSGEVAPRGVISGQVVDGRTGAALKGALVEIGDSGRQTSTDDLGEFRFSGLGDGTYNVRISYLGYSQAAASIQIGEGRGARRRYELIGGSAEQEIVVYGQRSARAQALNQERTAENVQTVISADLLGDFNGTTISESLRRAPGVIFQRDTASGDGTNIIVRGLAPDFNTVKLNGVELPESSGQGRSASLGNILTESISKVTISKTLLPNQDSSGSGGLIDIETKTPLDRPHRYASFFVEGGARDKGFYKDRNIGGTVSGTFGARRQFGLSASVQYRKQSNNKISYSSNLLFGQYLPLQVDGQPTITSRSAVDPRVAFPFESGATEAYVTGLTIIQSDNQTESLNIGLSAAWQVNDASKITVDYNKLKRKDSIFTSNMRLGTFIAYELLPVASLGGEQRRAISYRSNRFTEAVPSFSYDPDRESETDSLSIRGETHVGRLKMTALGGYTTGHEDSTLYSLSGAATVSPSNADLLPEAFHPVEGRVLSPWAQRRPGDNSVPEFLFSQSGFNKINNSSLYRFSTASIAGTEGRNRRYIGELAANYEFPRGLLRYIEAGVLYEDSKFSNASPLKLTDYLPNGAVTFNALGLNLSEGSLNDIGVDIGLNRAPRGAIAPFLATYMDNIAQDCVPTCPAGTLLIRSPSPIDPRRFDQYTNEKELAYFLQTSAHWGGLEVVGGVRASRIEVESANLSAPRITEPGPNGQPVFDRAFFDANSGIFVERISQKEYLPRVLLNYRWSDNLVVRAGYYLTVSRPQIGLMSQQTMLSLDTRLLAWDGQNITKKLDVRKGNPDLKPAKTHSFDISVEKYDSSIGVLKLGGFYKHIVNLIENNITSGPGGLADAVGVFPDDPRFQDVIDNPEDYLIQVTVPLNNKKSARIWGLEASIEKQFTFLPTFWSGLGVYANYTFTDSSRQQNVPWNFSPVVDGNGNVINLVAQNVAISDVRFSGQARHSGTFGITYSKYGFDANLAYTLQARRQTAFDSNNLSSFEEGFGTLDLRAEYRFKRGPGDFRIYLEGRDLLRGTADASIESTKGADDNETPKYYTGGHFYGGRQLRLGIRASF